MNSQDIIYSDLFDIRNNFNKPVTSNFINYLWRCLSKLGIVAIKYAFEGQSKLIETLIEPRKLFTTTAVMEIKGYTNLVILAVKGDMPELELIGKKADQFEDIYNLQFKQMLDSITWLPERFDR